MSTRYIRAVPDDTARQAEIGQLPENAGIVYQQDTDSIVVQDPDSATTYALKLAALAALTAATPVVGVAAGYKIARGQTTTATASDTVVTGLALVVAVVASLDSAPVIGADRATASIGDQSAAPVAGSILVQTWKPTGTGDATPVAATTFSKKVNWIAIGT